MSKPMNSYTKRPEGNLLSGHPNRLKRSAASLLTLLFLMVITIYSHAQSPEIKKALRYIDIEQPSKGLSALEQLVSANPNNSNYLYYLGLAQLRTGAKDKALASFEKGIAAEEKDGLNYAG